MTNLHRKHLGDKIRTDTLNPVFLKNLDGLQKRPVFGVLIRDANGYVKVQFVCAEFANKKWYTFIKYDNVIPQPSTILAWADAHMQGQTEI